MTIIIVKMIVVIMVIIISQIYCVISDKVHGKNAYTR